ncbi:hypothetical protein SEVIR_1G132900v4 [Setaria viridis]|uniref:non-specific serine/threonine protein kinase n=2 Tax=Setaria TaxID=4554 RepID=K3YQI1_SETIT|nr:L-type lectin-domain containing receptor kinase IV.2 [Setaria italica]XP_034596114.1 L-type lectin-domain containing receptor kinase SIT1-like [Setaria viridis]RCV06072.1 hypothetical protein SETIT_1G134400v2 [Setaria italica]TKW38702.1 hypothetical protein SEVIR_1G132900v2 [Setaria viridis]
MLEAKRVFPLLFFYGIHLAAVAVSGGSGGDDDEFVYSGFAAGGSNLTHLTLDGTAKVTPTGLLELTNGTAHSKGHAFHPTPLRLREPDDGGSDKKKKAAAAIRSFSATFVFGIVPPAAPGVGAGHGLALVVSPTKDLSSGMATSYLGFLNGTKFFAVELDTVMSTEFHDKDNNHVGVDVDTLVSAAAASAGYYDDRTGEFTSLTLISGEAMQAWVDYDSDAGRVDVRLAPIRTGKPRKPLVSTEVNLSTVIGEEAYVGFSSSTGTLTSRHYVLGWSFAVGEPAPAIDMSRLPKLPQRSSESPSKALVIALPVVAGGLTLATVACVLLLVRRRYRYVELREDWEIEFGAHRLSYKDLFHATDGFKSKNLLGAGGFGTVYRGTLAASGTEVAVKRVAHGSQQGMKEFVAEVATVGRLRHRNLVQLLGYCRRNDELLLAYEYMANGSLEKHLYGVGGEPGPTLIWAQRFQVIKGVASGLLYLHEEWEQAVVHRDVKASNILLDSEMNARLGDFGLARLQNHDAELHTTVVAGTFGYIAPELALTGKASPLTDVFAFGAFLLEVVTGRRPVEDSTDGHRVMLVDWVLEHWRNESLAEAVDPRIQGGYDVDEVSLALRVGLMCSHPLAGVRPSMRQVMQYLAGDTPLPELTPAHMGMSMLALLQNQGLDSFVMANSSSSSASVRSFDTSLSRGR